MMPVDRGLFSTQEIQRMDHSTVAIKSEVTESTLLPMGFTPGPWSVICGRCAESYNNVGNKRLKVLVQSHLPRYLATSNRFQKTLLIASIVETVRENAGGAGAFVKIADLKTGQYMSLDDRYAKEKVGQLLRELKLKQNPTKLADRKQRRKNQAAKRKNKTMITTGKSESVVVTQQPEQMSCSSDDDCNSLSSDGSSSLSTTSNFKASDSAFVAESYPAFFLSSLLNSNKDTMIPCFTVSHHIDEEEDLTALLGDPEEWATPLPL